MNRIVYYLRRAKEIYQAEGIKNLSYRLLRFIQRRGWEATEYNGVRVVANESRPNFESGLVSQINKYVNEGDKVVIVGGGLGVTAVKAANKVGSSGEVIVYEASSSQITSLTATIEMNNVSDRTIIHNSIVGENISIAGEGVDESVNRIPPEDLPECDILELDCEGAELEIIGRMNIEPEYCFVESHGMLGSPSSEVKNLLQKNYEIVSSEVADKGRKQKCMNNDILVITARKED